MLAFPGSAHRVASSRSRFASSGRELGPGPGRWVLTNKRRALAIRLSRSQKQRSWTKHRSSLASRLARWPDTCRSNLAFEVPLLRSKPLCDLTTRPRAMVVDARKYILLLLMMEPKSGRQLQLRVFYQTCACCSTCAFRRTALRRLGLSRDLDFNGRRAREQPLRLHLKVACENPTLGRRGHFSSSNPQLMTCPASPPRSRSTATTATASLSLDSSTS